MAKKIVYSLSLEITINETELAFLKFLGKRQGNERHIAFTSKEVADKIGASESSVRRIYRDLATDGLIFVNEGRREDGSRTANSYGLTLMGRQILLAEKDRKVSKKVGARKKAAPKKPATTDKPAAAKKSSATDKSATSKKPSATAKKSAVTKKPPAAKEPVDPNIPKPDHL